MLRARDQKQKEERSRTILGAAETLFIERRSVFPTVDAVAREAGLAKGTLYLYFQSKEAIFLSLLEWRYFEWIDDALAGFALCRKKITCKDIIENTLRYPLENTVVLDLASLSSTQLETNVDDETAFHFKSGLTRRIGSVGRLVADRNDSVSATEAARAFLRGYSLLLGLWQLSDPVGPLKDVRTRAGIELFRIEFEPEARRGLRALWVDVLGED